MGKLEEPRLWMVVLNCEFEGTLELQEWALDHGVRHGDGGLLGEGWLDTDIWRFEMLSTLRRRALSYSLQNKTLIVFLAAGKRNRVTR